MTGAIVLSNVGVLHDGGWHLRPISELVAAELGALERASGGGRHAAQGVGGRAGARPRQGTGCVVSVAELQIPRAGFVVDAGSEPTIGLRRFGSGYARRACRWRL